jgi:hypothetical protein
MASQGIELPLKAVNGRIKLLSSDLYIEQLLSTALGSGECENPFLNVGLGKFMIFGINDAPEEAEIRAGIEAIFDNFQYNKLAKLHRITFVSENEEKKARISYQNMETGQNQELDVPVALEVE